MADLTNLGHMTPLQVFGSLYMRLSDRISNAMLSLIFLFLFLSV